MLRAVTIGYPHDADKEPTVIRGPEVPLADHLAGIKKAACFRTHPTFARIEVWDSTSGVRKSCKFITKEEVARRAKIEKAELDRLEKIEKDKLAKTDAEAEKKPEDAK